ncbi:MAG: ABC transporter permease [Alphaproteobacteria bacterium]|nr:ABC transporter permease [Alphaproteobacteria bacterium]
MTTPKNTPRLAPPSLKIDQLKNEISIQVEGSWVSQTVARMESEIASQLQEGIPKRLPVKVTIEKGCHIDTAGACLLAHMIKYFKERNQKVEINNLSSSSLVDYFLKFHPIPKPFTIRLHWTTRWLDHIGYRAYVFYKTAMTLLSFLGEILVTWLYALKSSANLRWISVFRHVEEIGIRAMPIIGLISFLIGMVLSYQSINQLRRFGAELYTIDFLGVSILREIAVLLTAIVVAGRSGSAFTAQIGTMSLNQEIDAIRMLGLSPIMVLVVPRLIAITVCLPILVFLSMIMGLLGGMVMTNLIIDVSSTQFFNHFHRAVSTSTFWVGMSKAPLFALLIGLVGCFRGFQVKGSAESVGRMTTQSVVESIFLVIICDAFMSILFSYLKV